MILCSYRTDGTRQVVAEHYTRAKLAEKAKRLEARDYNIDWDGPNKFEAQHDQQAFSTTYVLRPDDWPVRNGEPD